MLRWTEDTRSDATAFGYLEGRLVAQVVRYEDHHTRQPYWAAFVHRDRVGGRFELEDEAKAVVADALDGARPR